MFTKSSIGVSIAVLSVAAFLSACVPTTIPPDIDPDLSAEKARMQMKIALKVQYEQAKRLSRVSWPLLTRNLELCSGEHNGEYKQTYKFGISYDSLERHEDEDYSDILRDDFNVGLQPTILYVIPGSPADKAGMQRGDRITHMNGTKLGVGEDAMEVFAEDLLAKALQDHLAGKTTDPEEITLKILRGRSTRDFAVSPQRVCDYAVILKNRFGISSGPTSPFADGEAVYITQGVMQFIKNDHELAFVIGRELAHDSRGHITARLRNGILGGILGAVYSITIGAALGATASVQITDLTSPFNDGMRLGMSAFSEEFEVEADYVGIYYAARAGYDMRIAASLWCRAAEEYPELIHPRAGTYPSTAKRFLLMGEVMEEYDMKCKKGCPLVPFGSITETDASRKAKAVQDSEKCKKKYIESYHRKAPDKWCREDVSEELAGTPRVFPGASCP